MEPSNLSEEIEDSAAEQPAMQSDSKVSGNPAESATSANDQPAKAPPDQDKERKREAALTEKLDPEAKKQAQTVINNFFVTGDNQRFNVVNAENIQDSEIQGNASLGRTDSRDAELQLSEMPDSELAFEQYVHTWRQSPALYALLTIAWLNFVAEDRISALSTSLRDFLGLSIEKDETETGNPPEQFFSLRALMQSAFLEPCTAIKNTNAGKVSIRCLRLREGPLRQNAQAWIWQLFPQLRGPLVHWLYDMTDDDDPALMQAAVSGLAACTALDFGYARENILPFFTHKAKLSEISTLYIILEKLIGEENNRENAEILLVNWMKTRGSHLWMVGVRLAAQGTPGRFHEEIPHLFDQLLRHTFYQGEDNANMQIFAENCLMTLARQSKEILNALAEVLSTLFSNQSRVTQQRLVASRLLSLLVSDYLMENKRDPHLALLGCLEQSDCRALLRPIWVCIWETAELRRSLQRILTAYYQENQGGQVLERPSKRLFLILAFNQEHHDYQLALDFFTRLGRISELRTFSLQMYQWLEDVRVKRS